MPALIQAAARVIPAACLGVNPDGGLKTRQEEVKPALEWLVAAARQCRTLIPRADSPAPIA